MLKMKGKEGDGFACSPSRFRDPVLYPFGVGETSGVFELRGIVIPRRGPPRARLEGNIGMCPELFAARLWVLSAPTV